MTTESNDNDPRVSDAYRDLASEKTPPELDRKVLSMVAGNERTRYGLARAWVRPVAWAATIGLSLAFVLELSQVQDRTPVAASGSDAEVLDEAPARAKSDGLLRQELEERSDAPAATVVTSPPVLEQEPALDRDSVADDFEADDMSLVHEAEERARLQSGSSEPAPAAAEIAAFAEKKEQALSCDADARSTAETWYACIEELRRSDLAEPARLELELLLAEFPEFQEPDPDR